MAARMRSSDRSALSHHSKIPCFQLLLGGMVGLMATLMARLNAGEDVYNTQLLALKAWVKARRLPPRVKGKARCKHHDMNTLSLPLSRIVDDNVMVPIWLTMMQPLVSLGVLGDLCMTISLSLSFQIVCTTVGCGSFQQQPQ